MSDKTLSKATPDEMVEALDARGIGAILLTFKPDDIDNIIDGSAKLNMISGECLTTEQTQGIIKILAAHFINNG